MKKIYKKSFIVITGFVFGLVLLEFFLRIFGIFYYSCNDKNFEKGRMNYTVLTIGDSYTYGIGSKNGKTYPAQLESLLNTKTKKKFKVSNAGLNGENTAQVVENLEKDISMYHPDLIIFLTGGANFWNFYGYYKPIYNILYKIKVFKLFKLIYKNIVEKKYINAKSGYSIDSHDYLLKNENRKFINLSNRYRFYIAKYRNKGANYMQSREFIKAIEWFKGASFKEPHNYSYIEGIVYSYLLINKHNEAINVLLDAINMNKNNVRLYSLIGFVYSIIPDYKEAEKWLEKGISINDKYGILYYQLVKVYYLDNNFIESDKWLAKGIDIEPMCFDFIKYIKENGQINNFYKIQKKENISKECYSKTEYDEFNDSIELNRMYLPMRIKLDSAYIDVSKISLNSNYILIFNWLASDIEKIICICNNFRVKIMFQNYPANHFPHPDMPANYLLNKYFNKWENIPFVNNEECFIKAGALNDNYFVKDGHCNNKGYGLMAKNVFEKIISERIFEVDTVRTIILKNK